LILIESLKTILSQCSRQCGIKLMFRSDDSAQKKEAERLRISGHMGISESRTPMPAPAPIPPSVPLQSSTPPLGPVIQVRPQATVLSVDSSLLPPRPPLTATSSTSTTLQKQTERTRIFEPLTKDRFGKRTFHVCSGMFSVEYYLIEVCISPSLTISVAY
jgi:hypothetical protein